jgi:hypothetical protein
MKTKTIYFISILFFVDLLFILPKNFISGDLGGTVLTISTFLFGLIAGFYIVVTTTDYNSLKTILAIETAGWISLFNAISVYDKKTAKELVPLIDEYTRHTFDYEIIDYARKTGAEFEKVVEKINQLKLNQKNMSMYEKVYEALIKITEARQQLIVLGTKALSFFQWAILLVLGGLVVASLYGLRTGEIFFEVVTVMISSCIVLILFLIRDLDLYIWNEKTFGYDIFQNIFRAIGQLPYYPEESIKARRVHPEEERYRIGTFVDFPKSLKRKIAIKNQKLQISRRVFDFWN